MTSKTQPRETKEQEATEVTAEASACVHQWMIAPPNGPTSEGQCKLCGETRAFHNSLEISYWDNQKRRSPWARSSNRNAKTAKSKS